MQFHLLSLFPEMFESYFSSSILGRAQAVGVCTIVTHQLRDYALDKHSMTDDTPYGGGAGMVMKVEPILLAIEDIQKKYSAKNSRVLLTSAKGAQLKQVDMREYADFCEQLIIICGRYEGVDERVMSVVDDEIAIGEYVLTGGELGAMVVVDAVSRLLPGVLGNSDSFEDESHTQEGVLEYPQYTKPAEFCDMKVPEVLLSGDHGNIAQWREEQRKQL